jgi:hypothetical protein
MNAKTPKPIRDLMPEGYTRIIAAETMAYPSTISEAVVSERTNSKLWPIIERLAKETDSKAYKARMEWLSATRGQMAAA